MNDIGIIIAPTMYLLAMVTGFMLNTCGQDKRIRKLEEDNDELEWENLLLAKKLRDAEMKLNKTEESETDITDLTDS
jgi:hypothetical protein